MNATGKRRLLKLADFLDALKLKRSKFNMRIYANDITKDGKPACGTAACAAGWAASIPSFRKAGYRLACHQTGSGITQIVPVFGRAKADRAICKFFAISIDGWSTLFGPFNPNSPKKAAKRIRKLVASA